MTEKKAKNKPLSKHEVDKMLKAIADSGKQNTPDTKEKVATDPIFSSNLSKGDIYSIADFYDALQYKIQDELNKIYSDKENISFYVTSVDQIQYNKALSAMPSPSYYATITINDCKFITSFNYFVFDRIFFNDEKSEPKTSLAQIRKKVYKEFFLKDIYIKYFKELAKSRKVEFDTIEVSDTVEMPNALYSGIGHETYGVMVSSLVDVKTDNWEYENYPAGMFNVFFPYSTYDKVFVKSNLVQKFNLDVPTKTNAHVSYGNLLLPQNFSSTAKVGDIFLTDEVEGAGFTILSNVDGKKLGKGQPIIVDGRVGVRITEIS